MADRNWNQMIEMIEDAVKKAMKGMFMPKQGPGPYGPNVQQGLANQGIGSANPNQAVTGNSIVWVSGLQGMSGAGSYGSTQSQPTKEQLDELKFKEQVAKANLRTALDNYAKLLAYAPQSYTRDVTIDRICNLAAILARSADEGAAR